MKKWIPFFIVCLIIAGGYFWKNWGGSQNAGLPDSLNPLTTAQETVGKKPVLLEFISDTCIYCEQMKPIIQALYEEYGEKVEFIIANTDQNEEAASLAYFYKIRGVPTIVVHDSEGKISATFIGYTGAEELAAALKKVAE